MVIYNRKEVKSWAKSKIPFLWEKRVSIGLAMLALLFLYLFRDVVQMIIIMAVFIALGTTSLLYNRWIKLSLGFELIMLGTVITAMVYGRWQAIVVGFIALFLAEVLTDRFTYSTFISFIGLAVIAAVVPLVSTIGITWTGITMTLLYDIIIVPGYLLMGSSPWRTFVFLGTHIMFNVWVFIFLAPLVFRIVS